MNALLTLLVQHSDNSHGTPSKELDQQLRLDGYSDFSVKRLALPPGAADQAVALINCIAVVVFSHDHPFGVRLGEGETLLEHQRLWISWCASKDEGAVAELLLSGNGDNTANLEVWLFEQPA